MKRLFALLITIIMVASLAACGTNNSNTNENNGSANGNESSGTVDNNSNTNENNSSANGNESGGTVENAMIPGTLNFIELDDRDPSVLRGLRIISNRVGSSLENGINALPSSVDNIRCIFELDEWVEFCPDCDLEYGLRVWVLEHRDDQEYYETAKFSDLMSGFVTYCDLRPDPDAEEGWYWGSFYLSHEEWEPGYYDFVFTYEGKALATMLTRFYNEGELINKSDAELMEIMNGERNVSGGSTDADSENTQTSKPEADENTTNPGSTSTYNFPGYTTEGTWPDATAWAGMGLPDLPVSNAGKVSISDKEWIYPLNAKDGVLFEARPESSHFDELVAALNAAGIEGEDNSDSFDKYYEADYTYNGAPMDIKISEYDTGKLTILVRYEPEN